MCKEINMILDSARMMWKMDRTVFITAVIVAVLEQVTPFVGIVLSAYVLDQLAIGADILSLIMKTVLAVALVFLLTVVAAYLDKLKQVHTEICVRKFDMESTKRTLTMDYQLLDSPLVNDIRGRITRDNDWGAGFYSVVWIIPKLLSHITAFIVSLIILLPLFMETDFFADWTALAFMGILLVVMIVSSIYAKNNRKEFYELRSRPWTERFFGYFLWQNAITYQSGKDVRVYNAEPMIRHYIDRDMSRRAYVYDTMKNNAKGGLANGLSSGLLMTLSYLFVVLRSIAGNLGIGSVVKYASMIYQLSNQVNMMIFSYAECVSVCQRMQSTFEYMNIPDVLYKGTLPVEKRDDNEYEIEFRDVSFKYPGSEQYALHRVSLKLKIGRKMAVVGMNGSGKTTFIKLLCRLYDPTKGQILLNGIDIRKYDYREYLSIFSVVFQDFKLFSFSLGHNIATTVEYDDKKVKDCLMKAGLEKRLDTLEQGSDTYLYKDFEPDGIEVSGGEAQKIAIARALYKDSPFIILDEPTAALDPIAEAEIYSKFNDIVGDKTAIYISHRLSSCRFCDNILVFDKGSVVQQGNHDSLLAEEGGKYHELWHAQAQYYEITKSVSNLK